MTATSYGVKKRSLMLDEWCAVHYDALRVVWVCQHRHPSQEAALDCALGYWIEIYDEPPPSR